MGRYFEFSLIEASLHNLISSLSHFPGSLVFVVERTHARPIQREHSTRSSLRKVCSTRDEHNEPLCRRRFRPSRVLPWHPRFLVALRADCPVNRLLCRLHGVPSLPVTRRVEIGS